MHSTSLEPARSATGASTSRSNSVTQSRPTTQATRTSWFNTRLSLTTRALLVTTAFVGLVTLSPALLPAAVAAAAFTMPRDNPRINGILANPYKFVANYNNQGLNMYHNPSGVDNLNDVAAYRESGQVIGFEVLTVCAGDKSVPIETTEFVLMPPVQDCHDYLVQHMERGLVFHAASYGYNPSNRPEQVVLDKKEYEQNKVKKKEDRVIVRRLYPASPEWGTWGQSNEPGGVFAAEKAKEAPSKQNSATFTTTASVSEHANREEL